MPAGRMISNDRKKRTLWITMIGFKRLQENRMYCILLTGFNHTASTDGCPLFLSMRPPSQVHYQMEVISLYVDN